METCRYSNIFFALNQIFLTPFSRSAATRSATQFSDTGMKVICHNRMATETELKRLPLISQLLFEIGLIKSAMDKGPADS